MRRVAAIFVVVVGLPVFMALTVGADGGGGGYKVRAIFDNASFVVPGEDVKVAGVKVGSVDSTDVTKNKKAAIVLSINSSGFSPFHTDAHCAIRPQSLIGERYVECTPGTANLPDLPKIPKGVKGSGQALLVKTSSPVDIDLINNIMRLPFRQRFALIINEFGVGLAGRGGELNEAIHRANPALRDTDKVLAILASQNRDLARLAKDSDTVITPLAAQRRHVAHFIVAANETGQATAEQSANVEATFQRLPTFLRQLKPTLVDLGVVSDQSLPVLTGLHQAAPDLARFTQLLGPFSQAATPAVVSLGKATVIGRPALVDSLPTVRLLAQFAQNAAPVAANLVALTKSLDQTGAIAQIMNYVFFQTTAINGFDGVSHYLRAGLITNLCSLYATQPVGGCNANFTETRAIGAAKAQDPTLLKTRKLLESQLGPTHASPKSGAAKKGTDPFAALNELTDPRVTRQRNQSLNNARGGGRDASPAFGRQTPQDQAMDYLLGNGG
jgi:ABC-type transporter Mla subunit MlaD